METIILASGSPRRRDLLARVKLPFKAVSPEAAEASEAGGDVAGLVQGNARRKVEAVLALYRAEAPTWVLGVDTVVELDGEILGKPAGAEQAEAMLRRLSGRTHRVWSGLALHVDRTRTPNPDLEVACTEVTFLPLTDDELARYVETGEWAGAAGAYRIQERGAFLVQAIRGSWSNVVGLPLEAFYGMLRRNGYPF